MQEHTIIYFNSLGISPGEYTYCEICGKPSTSIHHISGRGKDKNVIENLMALCMEHHEICHTSVKCNLMAKDIHNKFLLCNPYNNPEQFDNRIFEKQLNEFNKLFEEWKKNK